MKALALLLLLPFAAAFGSLPPGTSPHDEITRAAAEAVEWPSSGVRALQEAVRAPDIDEFIVEGDAMDWYRLEAREAFRAQHHCDRVPPEDNETAFAATLEYVHQQRDEARAMPDARSAVRALGRALHAAQDCFSHSNFVDLPAAAQAAFRAAFVNGETPPGGVVLTAFEPGTNDTTNPDDPYPHDTYAKDDATGNEESQIMVGNRTKYQVARDAAIQVSAAMMAAFLGPLNETQRDAVAALRADEGTGKGASGWGFAGGLVALAVIAAASRR